MPQPFLPIIIPVFNGGADIEHCLQAIVGSDYEGWELIVVDGGSTDNSAAIAQHYATTVLSTMGRSDPAAAHNLDALDAQAATCYGRRTKSWMKLVDIQPLVGG